MKMRGASVILRRFVGRRAPCLAARSSSIGDLIVSSAAAAASYSTLILAEDARPLFVSAVASGAVSAFHPFFMNQSRNFSSAPSPDSSKVVSIESEEQFNDSVRKAEEESQPSIFYFTAAWCGPCRLLSPMIGQLSEKYPHVTTYKIDIDKKGLENAVSKSNIHSVPTLHFFQNGKKAGEVIGADVERLKDTMEALYNTPHPLDDPRDYKMPADFLNLKATLQGKIIVNEFLQVCCNVYSLDQSSQ